ncbi:hypothetical protein CEUSTIGMA_g8591.t1 [Chlamydomonas eustigma]|uniref:HECT-type E3 ubiquitin transferase n=1 Tax=Chlamydomonas eustigma TaxID=1157962 RepID=A0A250XDK0_9CHLO|nr:hypothetical protein CEUSTIGMA_g8591.t1 [Chlamydomonas eustigma]|eukprot:GAX81158.1 hypothetical protein CEUSTIGMA_g8591.t1 [Chlamydomonas eustigma]
MFNGTVGARKKVSLGGKSQKEGSRDDVLEKSRLERERRRREKIEDASARLIQARWRIHKEWKQFKTTCLDSWNLQFGPKAELADLESLDVASSFLRFFPVFLDVRNFDHLQKLAGICSFLVRTLRTSEGVIQFAARWGSCSHLILLRLSRLSTLILTALHFHRGIFATVLSKPRKQALQSISSMPADAPPSTTKGPTSHACLDNFGQDTMNEWESSFVAVALAEFLTMMLSSTPQMWAPAASVAPDSLPTVEEGSRYSYLYLPSEKAPSSFSATAALHSATIDSKQVQRAPAGRMASSIPAAIAAGLSRCGGVGMLRSLLLATLEKSEETLPAVNHVDTDGDVQMSEADASSAATTRANVNKPGSTDAYGSAGRVVSVTQQRAVSYMETLCTQIVVRILALPQIPAAGATTSTVPTSERRKDPVPAGPARMPSASFLHLLCLPGLWHRVAPSLVPVAPRIVRQAVSEVSAILFRRCILNLQDEASNTFTISSQQLTGLQREEDVGALVAELPEDGPGAKAGAMAALLANIIEVGVKVLLTVTPLEGGQQQQQQQQQASMTVALDLVRTLRVGLSLLPLSPFFQAAAELSLPSASSGITITGAQAGNRTARSAFTASLSSSAAEEAAAAAAAAAADEVALTREVLVAPTITGGFASASTAAAATASRGKTEEGAFEDDVHHRGDSDDAVEGIDQDDSVVMTNVMRLTWRQPPSPTTHLGTTVVVGASSSTTASAALPSYPPSTSPPSSQSLLHTSRPPPYLVSSIQSLWESQTGRFLISQLLGVLLPATTQEAVQKLRSTGTNELQYLEGGFELCLLLRQLIALPAHRHRLLLYLAVTGNLVQRLWFSVLKPCRQIDMRLSMSSANFQPSAWGRMSESMASASCVGVTDLSTSTSSSKTTSVTVLPSSGQPNRGTSQTRWMVMLGVTSLVFSSHIMTADLDDFYMHGRPLPMTELYNANAPGEGFLALLRDALFQLLWQQHNSSSVDSSSSSIAAVAPASSNMTSSLSISLNSSSKVQLQQRAASASLVATRGASVMPQARVLRRELCEAGGRLYCQLYDRSCRHYFAPPATFHAVGLLTEQFLQEALNSRLPSGELNERARVWQMLRHAPCLVPFQDRARFFQTEVAEDRQVHYAMQQQGQSQRIAAMLAAEEAAFSGEISPQQLMIHQHQIATSAGGAHRFVSIRRGQLLEDGYQGLAPLGESLKGKVRVQFIDEHGTPEAGVDGGGLFKDFMESLIKEAFNSEQGLFASTSANELYPNPAAFSKVPDAPQLLEFMGRMLGKALYEGILVELRFAAFFLKQFRLGSRCDVNDLPTLDMQLYRNLMMLRQYKGDVADLSLTFTVNASASGQQNLEVELKPGGRDIAVTKDNVVEYIHRVSDFRLNQQPRGPTAAFLKGFFALVRPQWVSMFNAEELQLLMGGSEEGLNLEDMKRNINYEGGYHEDHPVVKLFWEAVESFTTSQQRDLLRFVTSCSRAPLLGFKYLEPRICIYLAGSTLDDHAPDRLPTAATCMNMLKLPPYRSLEAMTNKLLYAIQSGAGFDLS